MMTCRFLLQEVVFLSKVLMENGGEIPKVLQGITSIDVSRGPFGQHQQQD